MGAWIGRECASQSFHRHVLDRRNRREVSGPQIINDSKTPSGRVHVGALRGVLIHDAIFRTLREKGIEARYLFGVDDYDPVDEIPKGEDEHFGQYIGWPLCNTPAPRGGEGDMAEHYMREFWQVFEELGVKVERYRMRDIYRGGQFNEPIDRSCATRTRCGAFTRKSPAASGPRTGIRSRSSAKSAAASARPKSPTTTARK